MNRGDPLILHFISLLDGREEEMQQYLSTGSCTSYDDYMRITGLIRGVGIAKELLDEAFKTYNQDEEDE